MAGHWTRGLTAAVLTALVAGGAAGCSDDGGSPSDAVSKAASIGAEATAKASSLASEASEALASATAEAGRKLDDIKGGVDVKNDVQLGDPGTDGEGRTTVAVTADNTADSQKSFAVQVNFKDPDGNPLDTVVVTVADVPAGRSGDATARSTHKLSGEVRTEVGTAVRY